MLPELAQGLLALSIHVVRLGAPQRHPALGSWAQHSAASAPALRQSAHPAAATDAMSCRFMVTATAPGAHCTKCPTTQDVLRRTLHQAAAPNAWQLVTAQQAHLPPASLVQLTPCTSTGCAVVDAVPGGGRAEGLLAAAQGARGVHAARALRGAPACRRLPRWLHDRVRVPTPARWQHHVEQARPGEHASHPAPHPEQAGRRVGERQAGLVRGCGGTRHPAAVSPKVYVWRRALLLGILMWGCPCGRRASCAPGTVRLCLPSSQRWSRSWCRLAPVRPAPGQVHASAQGRLRPAPRRVGRVPGAWSRRARGAYMG